MNDVITVDAAKAIVATKVHPRVTEQGIKEKIVDVDFLYKGTLTLCVITMRNGFMFVGKAAPAHPDNFDREVGKAYSYEDAFKQIWTHEGYRLREELYGTH